MCPDRNARQGRRYVAFLALLALFYSATTGAAPHSVYNGTPFQQPTSTPDTGERGGVSIQSGTFSYSYAVDVPPGRLGVEPEVSLTYASDAPIYGGIAAGWTMSIPAVRLDTRNGVMTAARSWTSDLVGAERLYQTSETGGPGTASVFRARRDTQMIRHERQAAGRPFEWVARESDGTTYRFGRRAPDHPTNELALLEEVEDANGNLVQYDWDWFDVPIAPKLTAKAYALASIAYTSNPTASRPPFARVDFAYDSTKPCPGSQLPVGSQLTLRSGAAIVDGYFRLRSITTSTADRTTPGGIVDAFTLVYDDASERCDLDVAPRRLLLRINRTGWAVDGTSTPAPPVSFDYNPQSGRGYAREQWIIDSERESGHLHSEANIFVDQMLMDMDGDGLPDKVVSQPNQDDCDFYWLRNTGSGFEDTRRWVDRPALPYGEIPADWALDDGPYGLSNLLEQRCALNAQYTLVTSATLDESQCRHDGKNWRSGTVVNWRFLDVDHDGLLDMVAGVDINTLAIADKEPGFDHRGLLAYDVERVTNASFKAEVDALIGAAKEQYEGPVSFECAGIVPRSVGNWYQWIVFRNKGAGHFADTPELWGMPAPVVATTVSGRTTIGKEQAAGLYSEITVDADLAATSAWSAADPFSFVDVDGDGYLDIVSSFKGADELDGGPPALTWKVMKGLVDGMFEAESVASPYQIEAPAQAHANGVHMKGSVTYQFGGYNFSASANGLQELNGDGLPEFAWIESDNYDYSEYQDWSVTTRALYGSGKGLHTCAQQLGDCAIALGAPQTVANGGVTSFLSQVSQWLLTPQPEPSSQNAWMDSVLLDVDVDGRPDLVRGDTVRLNAGDTFLAPRALPAAYALAAKHMEYGPALIPSSSMNTLLSDVDGDGRLDPLVHQTSALDPDQNGVIDALGLPAYDEPGTWSVYLSSQVGPGLLSGIHNGSGGHTAVEYASVRDTSVAPDWHLPVQRWVVKSTVTTSGDATAGQVTRYGYRKPAWVTDDDGRHGFAGFREVAVESPAGGLVETFFDYETSAAGLPVESIVSDATLPGIPPRTITRNEWQTLQVHGMPVHVVRQEDVLTCSGGQTVAACREQGALRRTVTDWATVNVGTFARALVPTTVRVAAGADVNAVDSTTTTTSYRTFSSGDEFRMQTGVVERTVVTAPGDTDQIGYVEYIYDPQLRRLVEQRTKVDGQRMAVTRFTHDPGTGLILTTERPESVAAGAGVVSTVVYDSYAAQVRRTINEAGHVVTVVRDLGTGQELSVAGPGYKCPTAPTPCNESTRVWETSTQRYDGLGRLRSRHESFDNGPHAYVLHEVERRSYVDWVGTGVAENLTTSEQRISISPSAWTREEAVTDGLGRVVRETVRTFESGVPDAVTVYRRDDRGLVVQIEVPDPTQNTTARVSTYHDYDGLERMTSSWHSSGLGGTQRIAYDGLITETRLDSSDEGPAPVVRQQVDVYGRLVLVEERTSSGAWATTEYTHDANGNLRMIVDADGLVTTLGHDLAGNRLWVERSGRRWNLEYDLEGRATSSTAPHAPGHAAAYTSYTDYDAIGRVTQRVPAPGMLTPGEQQELGFGPVAYFYDEASASLGALNRITTPASVEEYQYDAAGNLTSSSQRFTVAGSPSNSVTNTVAYNAMGEPLLVVHGDGTQTSYEYDRRGFARKLKLGPDFLAADTRNVAGLVTLRVLKPSSPSSRVTWTYDATGRVTTQDVFGRKAPWWALTRLARQVHEYYASGDVKHVNEQVLSNVRNFDYQYDHQSQITRAQHDGGYLAEYGYTPAGRLLEARLATPPGADIGPRDVFYDYDEQDLERVRALIDTASGQNHVALTHNERGDVTERNGPAGATSYRYDGDGNLRVVVRGSERETFQYDASGRRVLALRYANGTPTRMRRWFGNLEVETSGSTSTTTLTLSLGAAVARMRNGALEYLHQNATGNLLLALNSTGYARAGFSYGAFGEVLERQQSADDFRRRFHGRERDELSGWYDFGHRLYDPELLLWNRADPLFQIVPDEGGVEPRRMSLYAFNLNNPVRYVDPDGTNPVSYIGGLIAGFMRRTVAWVGRGFASAGRAVVGAVTAPVRAVRGVADTTVRFAWAHAAPCSGNCPKKPTSSPGKVIGTIVFAAATIIAPELTGLRTALRSSLTARAGAGGGGASAVAAGTRVASGTGAAMSTRTAIAVAQTETAPVVARATVDRVRMVAQQGFDYAVMNPRIAGLNRMGLGKHAEVLATRWTRKWAVRNGVDLGAGGLQFQVRGAHSVPDLVYHPSRSIFDFKLTPKAVKPAQTANFRTDFPGYSIDYVFGPGPWR